MDRNCLQMEGSESEIMHYKVPEGGTREILVMNVFFVPGFQVLNWNLTIKCKGNQCTIGNENDRMAIGIVSDDIFKVECQKKQAKAAKQCSHKACMCL